MGMCYSCMVFQPPYPIEYEVHDNQIPFHKVRDGFPDRNITWLPVHHIPVSGKATIPAVFIAKERPRYTILFSHGNAEDLGTILPYAEDLADYLRVNMMIYDYSGYGISVKSGPSESQFYQNIRAVYKYTLETCMKQCEAYQGLSEAELQGKMILMGRSLGSGPSCQLALEKPIRGLILISPIASCVRVMIPMKKTLCIDMFSNIDKIDKIAAPILICHGENDEVVPCQHGKSLYEKAVNKVDPLWVKKAGHNDLESRYPVQVRAKMNGFLDHLDTTSWSNSNVDDFVVAKTGICFS